MVFQNFFSISSNSVIYYILYFVELHLYFLCNLTTIWKHSFEEINNIFAELPFNPLYTRFNAHIISAFWQAEFLKQASSDLVWNALNDVEQAADTESTGVVTV